MQNSEIKNRDHNYSEIIIEKFECNDGDNKCVQEKKVARRIVKNSTPVAMSTKEIIGEQIKDINELKKITPKVKLLSRDVTCLNELTKINKNLYEKRLSTIQLVIPEATKIELNKYCRTCAGMKLPLVNIFGEKGIQMRLSQQLKHLEVINEHDSLSTQMCMDCICDLKMSYKFFMQIKKAEVKLKSIHHTLTETAIKQEKLQSVITQEPEKIVETNFNIVPSTSQEYRKTEPKISINSMNNISNTEKNISSVLTKADHESLEEIPVAQQEEDNESLEEFDPDDPPSHSSDFAESDEEHENPKKRQKRDENPSTFQNTVLSNTFPQIIHQEEKRESLVQPMYKYNADLKAYVKVNVEKEEEQKDESMMVSKVESKIPSDSSRESMKTPNILKKKLPMQLKRELEITENFGSVERDLKLPKLNINTPLDIPVEQEDGIMYVTVKGTKPNELLLVKVKKMDKPLERKEEKAMNKKPFDIKPVEKILKKFEGLIGKEKDLFSDRVKKADIREQIIEEQIEEYKKKREKLLGQGNPVSIKLEDGSFRFVKRSTSEPTSENPKVSEVKEEAVTETDTSITKVEVNSRDILEVKKEEEETDESQKNVNKYLTNQTKFKNNWEETKIKREYLQQELNNLCEEDSFQKLSRILGESEENLQDFQDYLKQRRIVINRLKDEDIISLYEDRNNTSLKKSLPDLIDESQPVDYIPEEDYLECDYCPATFCSKEMLEDHLKLHDYKIMHYCEDCTEEFPTNKAKRNHNLNCLKKLQCKYCNTVLDSKGKKRQHEQKHCDNLYGQLCDVCGEKFKHQGTLDQHFKTQHMSWEKIFQCPKCPKKFAFKQKLSFHLKSVHTTMRAYLCEDCGADFKNPASLRHHRIRKHQPVGNKRECPVCHKLVPFYSLSKHMHTHKAYTIQCPHCDKMFKNSSTLKQHVRIHEDQRQYRCDTCGVGFNRRDGLRLHMRVHEKTGSRGLKECSCQVCGEKFPNHSTLVIHRNRVHKDGRQYTCHICNRSMISTRSLEWHMSHIHNETVPGVVKDESDGGADKKRVSCYHCNKTFKTEMILRTHIKNTHMEKDPMKCLDCEETFTSEVRLRHHMMVTHNRLEGTLPCPHCPKRFVNQLRLKTHMISHSEERPYSCEICGFNLKTKIQLIKHHQNRHSDERPLQCRYCPWRCKQVSALVCHERTHTNERPYSCSVCRQRFKYLGDKNKHERRHESLGGSGFKRIVPGRNIKQQKLQNEETSSSEQDQETLVQVEEQLIEEQYDEQMNDEDYEEKYEGAQIIKFEEPEISEEYEQVYEQEYEETSREASEAAEVIMNMEETTVYTEEVTSDNIESAEIMADQMITSEILQTGTVVHLQQQDDTGKIQVIPVMLSLPDLTDANAEVNLATASIMYNN
ncbi:uncharacterized protein [Prorops nasuta]|uniref:uncharacterized protein n=1 Tax=Prorops nasuta TaxID=863751 RepID=UPI0034CD7E38